MFYKKHFGFHLFLLLLVFCALLFFMLFFSGCGGGYKDNPSTTTTNTVTPISVYAPTFALASGSYEANSVLVTIESQTANARIYYTTDGSTPTVASSLYSQPLSLASSAVVKAIASLGSTASGATSAWYDIYWWQALGNGLNDSIKALAFDSSGNLYAGGAFTTAGNVSAAYVAKWNGSDWSAVSDGTGLNSTVNTLAFDSSGNLYAGGEFTKTGSYCAKWDGSAWSNLGGSVILNSSVKALLWKSSDSLLYLGGLFTTASGGSYGFSLANIAQWNGSSFSPLGTGMSGESSFVKSLALDSSGNLYAGGTFTKAGGVSNTTRIAKWDGSSWTALSTGMEMIVSALIADSSGNLYAGGDFATAGGVSANKIAKWDGSSWSALSEGLQGSDAGVSALLLGSANTYLYAGGTFSSAGGDSAKNIARWSLSGKNRWSALGSGTNGAVNALAMDSAGNLYAAGDFTTAGEVSASHIAKWGKK